LTTVGIDALQFFYGKAIRENKGDAKAMSKTTQAILEHYLSTAAHPHQEDCLRGRDSKCSYNQGKATHSKTHSPIKDALPEALLKVVLSGFHRLDYKQFLVGCEKNSK